jgi:hypothetical protein
VPDLEYNAALYLESLQVVQHAPTPTTLEHYESAILNLIDQMVREHPGGALGAFLVKLHVDPDFIRTTIAGPEYDLFQ